MLILGLKISHLPYFKCNNNFPYKIGFVIFMFIELETPAKSWEKSNGPILGRTDRWVDD